MTPAGGRSAPERVGEAETAIAEPAAGPAHATGACAVAVAGVLTGRTSRAVTVHLPGGDLAIEWRESDNHVYMTGPAVEIFTGDWPC